MQDFGLETLARTGLVALVLSGSVLASSAAATAADLGPYVTNEEGILAHRPVRRRVIVEETYGAPLIEHRVIERRVVERRFAEGYEGPALVPPRYLPIVPLYESEGYEGPALVPPQYVPIVPIE